MIFIKALSIVIILLMGVLALKPLYLIIFYNFFRPMVQPWAIAHYSLFPGGQITGLFSIVFIFIAIASVLTRKAYKLFPPNALPLYILLYLSSCSFMNSVDIVVSFSHVLKMFTGVAMYVLTYNTVRSVEDTKKVLWGLLISTIIPMLYGYYQYATGTGSGDGLGEIRNRIGSFFQQPNAMGEFVCINLCAGLILFFLEQKRWKRVALFMIMGSLLVSLLLSLHRGSWIAFSVAIIFAYFPFLKKIKLRWYIISGSITIIPSMPIVLSRFKHLTQIDQYGNSQNTFMGRVNFWEILLNKSLDHPFVGHGIGTTREFFGHIPHNDYVRLLFETGVVGLFCYFIFLSVVWVHNIVSIKKDQFWYINYSSLVCVTYWIIISMTQNLIFSVSIFPIFMMFLGVTRKYPTIFKDK